MMEKVSGKLTVFFEEPFWVGVFERLSGGRLAACKVIFGAEPRDGEVYALILHSYGRLRFSPLVEAHEDPRQASPKRRQRQARRLLQAQGPGTRSQQALKLQQEQKKAGQAACARQRREEDRQRRFLQKQQKKKEKHRGR